MSFFIAKIENGKMNFGAHKDDFKVFLERHNGKRVQIELIKAKRSNPQNNFYWMYLGLIERETGNTANDLHEYFKRVFLPPKFIKVLKKTVRVPGSTTKLSKAEFGEYLDKICAETGVPLPDPEDAGFISNYGPLTPVLKEKKGYIANVGVREAMR